MADEPITDDRTTKEKAADVATTAREESRGVAADARGEAAAVVSEAAAQARNLADETRTALRQQGSDGTAKAAGAVEQLAGRLRALADGDTDHAGDLQRYARDLGDRLGGVAGRMQDRGLDGLVDDVQTFARRRPGVFLAVAAGAGFAAGRLFRGVKADAGSSSGSSDGNGDSSGQGLNVGEKAGGGTPAAAGSSQRAAGGATTAVPAAELDPGLDEQQRAAAPSGFSTKPTDTAAERTGPEGGAPPAATPIGGATSETPGDQR